MEGYVIDVANVTKKKFPSLKEAYEEIREMYQYERNRFQNIENKTVAFLTLNAILFALIPVFYKELNLFGLIALAFLGASILCSFKVLYLRDAKRPHEKYDDFYQNAKMNSVDLNDKFLLAYMESTKQEERINEDKTKWLGWIVACSIVAWIAFALGFLVKFVCLSSYAISFP